jgi:hypothetical protein
MMRKSSWIGMALLMVLMLAACGNDDDNDNQAGDRTAEPTVALTPFSETTPGSFDAGPDLEVTIGGGLPGCNDPNDTECPAPLDLDLDGELSAEGITIHYPTRYFTVTTPNDNTAGVPIEIAPNEDYPFEQEAVFQVFFTETVEQALSELTDPLTAEWDTGTLTGTIGVVKDQEQDPPINTIVGAFPVENNRVVVLRLVVDGKYGWDLFSRTYARMLESLAVTPEDGQ